MQAEWIRKPKGKACVVFVHGILSSGRNDVISGRKSGWTHESGAYWPELLKNEEALDALGIYVYSYQTSIFSGDYRVSDVVDDLKERMQLDGVIDSERIIFVCHSLGGIVVRKFLVERAADLMERKTVIGLFLVASPSLGSHYADWFSPLAQLFGHSQVEALRFVGHNTWLSDLDKEFQNLKEGGKLKIVGKELIEDKFIVFKRVLRTQVVESFAGARYFGEQYKVPKSDHHSIAKPVDKGAIQHKLLCKFIKSVLSIARPSTAQIEPQNRSRAANTSRAANERIIYDSTGRDVEYDFTGNNGQFWKLINGKYEPASPVGKGDLEFKNGVLNIKRFNRAGKYQVWLNRYTFDGREAKSIPPKSKRVILVSCEAKATGADHNLNFIILRREKPHEWLDHSEKRVTSKWKRLSATFEISTTEFCKLRIDDQVSLAPSSVQIRNVVVAEETD